MSEHTLIFLLLLAGVVGSHLLDRAARRARHDLRSELNRLELQAGQLRLVSHAEVERKLDAALRVSRPGDAIPRYKANYSPPAPEKSTSEPSKALYGGADVACPVCGARMPPAACFCRRCGKFLLVGKNPTEQAEVDYLETLARRRGPDVKG